MGELKEMIINLIDNTSVKEENSFLSDIFHDTDNLVIILSGVNSTIIQPTENNSDLDESSLLPDDFHDTDER